MFNEKKMLLKCCSLNAYEVNTTVSLTRENIKHSEMHERILQNVAMASGMRYAAF